ncbi:hypothetical protein Dimus_036926, partial [Dionaea muscipula]
DLLRFGGGLSHDFGGRSLPFVRLMLLGWGSVCEIECTLSERETSEDAHGQVDLGEGVTDG